MKKWIQNTAGLILSVFLALGLGAKVRAEDGEDALPAPAPTEVSEHAQAVPESAESAPALPDPPKSAAAPAASAPAAESPKPAESAPAAESPKPAETAPAEEPPKPAETAPAEEPPKPTAAAPAEEPLKPTAADPGEENTVPVDVPSPVAEPAPDEEPAPAGVPASVEEPSPAGVPASVEKPTPAEEPAPAEAPSPVEVLSPVEEPSPVEESAPVEEPVSLEYTSAASSDSSDENLAPADDFSETVTAPLLTYSAAPARSAFPSLAAANTVNNSDPAAPPDDNASAAGITVGGKDVAEEDGWTYDELSGQVGLVNFDHAEIDIVSSGLNGLNIAAAGFNHLGTISSEGDVHITGTGILLVDDVLLGETGGLYLHTLTDLYEEGTGSVAFFLRQYDNLYLMLNGTVPGILDEDYTVRDADLYVPSGSTLLLYTGGAVTDANTGGIVARYSGNQSVDPGEGDYEYNEVYSSLTLADSSSLTLESGAEISMPSTPSRVTDSGQLRSSLHVMDGTRLNLDGSVSGDGKFTLDGAGVMSGSGSLAAHSISIGDVYAIADCAVTMQSRDFSVSGTGSVKTFNIKDSDVIIHNSDAPVSIGSLGNSGNSLIVNNGSISVGSVVNSGELSLRVGDIYNAEMNDSYYIGGPVSGGQLECHGGLFEFAPEFRLLNGASVSNPSVITYDYSDTLTPSFTFPLAVSPTTVQMPVQGEDGRITVPVVVMTGGAGPTPGHYSEINIDSVISTEIYVSPNDKGQYIVDLSKAENYKDGVNPMPDPVCVEIQEMDGSGRLSMRFLLRDGSAFPAFELGNTYLIRLSGFSSWQITAPETPMAPPNTSFTGSGILGGSGSAGSGSGSPVTLRRMQKPSSDPENHSQSEPDPPAPDPDPPAPDPDPDPEASLPAASRNDRRVVVSPRGRYYTVRVYNGIREIAEPGQKMTARMKFTLPAGWNRNDIYAVFRNADGSLTAIRASYDEESGTLSFDTDLTGTFALISFPFDGKPYSDKFYDAISELEDIRLLPVRR